MNLLRKFVHYYLRQRQNLYLLAEYEGSSKIVIDVTVKFINHSNIHINKYSRIGPECHIDGCGGVLIGEGTILAPKVVILSSSHEYDQNKYLPYGGRDIYRSVEVGKGCWIGWGVFLVPGVKLGDGCVVAMGSVVSGIFPAGSVLAGNPAKVVKIRSNIAMIKKLVMNQDYYLKAKLSTGGI